MKLFCSVDWRRSVQLSFLLAGGAVAVACVMQTSRLKSSVCGEEEGGQKAAVGDDVDVLLVRIELE